MIKIIAPLKRRLTKFRGKILSRGKVRDSTESFLGYKKFFLFMERRGGRLLGMGLFTKLGGVGGDPRGVGARERRPLVFPPLCSEGWE